MFYNKIFVISDLHFGVRNNSLMWRDMMNDFYDWFIDDIKKQGFDRKTDALFILGDVFHSRESINVMMLQNVCDVFLKLKSEIDNIHILTGNHDAYYVDSNSLTTIKFLEELIPGTKCYYEYETIDVNGHSVLMLPWVTSFDKIHEIIDSDNSEYLFCHMDINDMKYSSGINIDKCADSKRLSKYKKIFSGHIHTRQDKGNVLYVGTPYQLDSSDYNNDKGYYVINCNDFSYSFVENQISPKYKKLNMVDLLEMTTDEAKAILNNNYCELFGPREIICNADLILFKQKLSELGVLYKGIDFTTLNESVSIEDDINSSTFDFNVYDACVKMLKEAKRSDTEINETMEYFNMLYSMTKNDTFDGITAS